MPKSKLMAKLHMRWALLGVLLVAGTGAEETGTDVGLASAAAGRGLREAKPWRGTTDPYPPLPFPPPSPLLLGDPCKNEAQLDVPFVQPFGHRMTTLKREAPAVVCEEGQGRRLQGATYSDHGHIIVSLLFDAETMGGEGSTGTGSGASALVGEAHTPTPGRLTQDASGKTFQDESEFLTMCATRAAQGYNSGMGEIFRKVAAITPIAAGAAVAHGRAADETNVSPKAAADLGVCDVDQ
ncbi:hypothetical protein T492DRAFT_941698 [Pavlovales sp. CCMP2436]|nr:hypothetical protein T492DRAFT_941698 [Pavlovales sp. CCMP2436]